MMKYFVALILCLTAVQARYNWKDTNQREICIEPVPTEDDDFGFRIAGGQEIEPQRLPYQVALFISIPGDDFFCGGCLISELYVLTAAHCIADATVVLAKMGAFNVLHREPSQKNMKSRTFFIHEAWDKKTIRNDIALIRLPTPVPFSDVIYPAKLPSANIDYTDTEVVVSGWGKITDNSTTISGYLRCVFFPIIKNAVCKNNYPHRVFKTNICTSGEGGKSACAGDSGGPVAILHQNSTTTIIGIVSFGATQCEMGHPGVHTRVSEYVPWIKAKMKANQ